MEQKKKLPLKLSGFNNLTKSLSFNIYDISYAPSSDSQSEYIDYIDEKYNSNRLLKILKHLVDEIGATIISSSTQDYDPVGASTTVLIAEEQFDTFMHLDKSHLSAHTYPESNSKTGISTFRVDIDVSTCGTVSPLKALDYLIDNFDSDIVIIDYKVRGFTRDIYGKKHYMDHSIESIQDFLSEKIRSEYRCLDVNNFGERIFHTKMILKKFNLDDYLFKKEENITGQARKDVATVLKQEIEEIFLTNSK